MLGRALLPPDPGEGALDHPVLGRRLESGVAMGDGDRRELAADRGRAIGQGDVREVGGEGLRLGRQRRDGARPAPGPKGRQIAGVAAPRARGEGPVPRRCVRPPALP